jgi:hypothetical protein
VFFVSRVEAVGSERECWGGSVTVISINLSVFFVNRVEAVGSEREWWGGSVTVISIQVCVFCQPSGSRRGQRGNVGVGV